MIEIGDFFMDLTAIGEILIDLTQIGVNEYDVPLFAANPGGAPANVVVAASRLGIQTAFIGKVGGDAFGAYLRSVLTNDGVDCSGLRKDSRPTTMAVVSVDPAGERSFRFVRGADQNLSPEEVNEFALLKSKILHFGSVSLTPGLSRNATIFAARAAHRAGVLVSYDPNYRAALWDDEGHAAEWMRIPLPLVDVIKLSEEEVVFLTGVNELEEGSRILAEQGVSLVLITLGGNGVFCRWKDQCWRQPGIPVKVADTNGAGDTFFGAVLSRLCKREAGPLEGLTSAELKDILAFANRAAAFTCSRSGAIPAMPRLSEMFGDDGQARLPDGALV